MTAVVNDVASPVAAPDETRPRAERLGGVPFKLAVLGMFTISFNATRVAGWAVSDLLFVLAAFFICLKIILGQTRDLAPSSSRRSPRLVMVGTLTLLTFGTLSSFFAPSPLTSMLVMARLGWVTIVWFWTLRAVCANRAAFFRLVGAWRVGLVVTAIAAALGSVGIPMFETNNNEGRQAAFTFHPGELMNFLIVGLQVAIAVAVVLPVTARSKRTTRWSFVAAGLLSYALFATGSTSGLVATVVGLVAMISVGVAARLQSGSARSPKRPRGPGRSPLTIMFGAVVVMLGLVLLFNSGLPIRERLDKLRSGDAGLQSSVGSRERANNEILGDLDTYLVVGLGPNLQVGDPNNPDLKVVNVQGDPQNGVHNMWLKMIYEEGLPALIGLWLILAAVARQSVRLVLSTRGTDLYPVAIGLFGGLVAANVSSMFGPTAFSRHFWLPVALIGCLWEVRRRELRAELMGEVGPDEAPTPVRRVPTRPLALGPPIPSRP